MARTSYYLSVTLWREQVTICQQHHSENKLLFVSSIMARISYYLSETSWWEQVTICQQHHDEIKLLFIWNIMARTSYYFSATSWPEQVTICQQHHGENKLLFVVSYCRVIVPGEQVVHLLLSFFFLDVLYFLLDIWT